MLHLAGPALRRRSRLTSNVKRQNAGPRMDHAPTKWHWNHELSDKEVHFIGQIVIHWGAIEYEVFTQTLTAYEYIGQPRVLPKAMNNLQFTEILDLWKEQVIAKAKPKVARTLQDQYNEIVRLKSYRDALVHGHWDWSATNLSQVSTVRVRKNDVITTRFTADDLMNFADRLASVNFKLRFPRGPLDAARKRGADGFYISRRALAMFTGHPLAEDPFPLQVSPDEGTADA